MRLAKFTAALVGCGALLGWSSCREAATPLADRPNVVLILIDTLRPDHLGFGGYSRETAPFLAGLAEGGTLFERAYSTSSWTAPSAASVFTGLYPPRHGVVRGFFAHFQNAQMAGASTGHTQPEQLMLPQLPQAYPTLAELFQEAGYRTYAVTTNINIGPEIGFDRGFDKFQRLESVPAAEVLAQLDRWKPEIMGEAQAPYFLYLHLNDVHAPYNQREQWYVDEGDELAKFISAYDSEISYLDTILKQLYEQYELDDDTLFAVVSDHGEEFLDHGAYYHGFSLHAELNQVLMLLHGPQLGIPARRVPVNVSLVDVLPTLVELAGLGDEALNNAMRNGRSLVPLLADGEPRERALVSANSRAVYAHRLARQDSQVLHSWAVMLGRWKLLEKVGQRQLFDLWMDRAELHDVSGEHPAVLRELGELLDELKARGIDEHGTGVEVELDSEMLERLNDLGYLK